MIRANQGHSVPVDLALPPTINRLTPNRGMIVTKLFVYSVPSAGWDETRARNLGDGTNCRVSDGVRIVEPSETTRRLDRVSGVSIGRRLRFRVLR